MTTDTGPQNPPGPQGSAIAPSSAAIGPQSGLAGDQGTAWPTETDQAKHERQHLLIDQAYKAWKGAYEAGVRRSPDKVVERLKNHLRECHGIIYVMGLPPTLDEMHRTHTFDHQHLSHEVDE